ncbi:hypothetical protein F5050DRAFT_397953 [Lentinula boryana]|uniref:Uncharacterized protein n=1 Tax=Lentinula boryana TaxID=40481 RepID=A0ABQ8Q8J5_9AGAR|nr:hypothetical protein F5050DRAFT_397953 [Lentinula boryana]
MPAFGKNQAFNVHVQDALPQVRANRRRNGSVLETTMIFRTAGDSATRVRAENASRIRISITGPKPDEEDPGFEATAYGRSPYNVRTSVTITHHDVNLALDPRNPRPTVRFVSVGPISEEDLRLGPGESPPPYHSPETFKPENVKVKVRPVSAPAPSAEVVKAMLDAPPTKPFVPARPTAPLRIITNPFEAQSDADYDSSAESPLNSPPLTPSYRPFQFSGGRSVEPRRMLLNDPLPSLCPRSPSESSFMENLRPESPEAQEVTELKGTSESSENLHNEHHVEDEQTVESAESIAIATSPSSDSLVNDNSVENTIEGNVSLTDSARSRSTNKSQHGGKVLSLTKSVKLKLYGSRQTDSSSTLPLGRSSMSPPPSAFQRFERGLGAAAGSATSLNSRVSLKNPNGVGSSSGSKGMKALLGKAMGIGKGMKRFREEEENMDPGDIEDNNDRPIAGRRTKRKLMGMTVGL